MIGHKECDYCHKIGHTKDMVIRKVFGMMGYSLEYWYHEECYKILFNIKRCPCGKGWIKNK